MDGRRTLLLALFLLLETGLCGRPARAGNGGQAAAIAHPRLAVSAARTGAFELDAQRAVTTGHRATSGTRHCCTLRIQDRVSITVPGETVTVRVGSAGMPAKVVRVGMGAYVADLSGRRFRLCPATGTVSVEGLEAGPGRCLEWTAGEARLATASFDVTEAYWEGIPAPPPHRGQASPIDYSSLLARLEDRDEPVGPVEEEPATEVSAGATCLDTSGSGEAGTLPDQGGTQVEIEPRPARLQVEVKLIRK